MLTPKIIIKKIEENKEIIKKFGVKELTLVGSYANEDADKKSDIDFLVEFEEGRGLFDDYVHLRQFLQDLFGKDIDLGERHLLKEEIKRAIFEGEQIEARI